MLHMRFLIQSPLAVTSALTLPGSSMLKIASGHRLLATFVDICLHIESIMLTLYLFAVKTGTKVVLDAILDLEWTKLREHTF